MSGNMPHCRPNPELSRNSTNTSSRVPRPSQRPSREYQSTPRPRRIQTVSPELPPPGYKHDFDFESISGPGRAIYKRQILFAETHVQEGRVQQLCIRFFLQNGPERGVEWFQDVYVLFGGVNSIYFCLFVLGGRVKRSWEEKDRSHRAINQSSSQIHAF